jgi:putative ABC transport system ATP-binding protein
MSVQLQDLSRSFVEGDREHAIFRNVNLHINTGQIVVLLGRSGSGKSTLLNLISGIDRPDAGTVSINGTDLHRLNERERTLFRRRHIGFVFQFFNLVSTLTVRENLCLPLELNGQTGKEAVQKADDLLQEVGLYDRADSFPDLLSGGEQQRIAIVRALIHEPELILADEPTGNLDKKTGVKILELLDGLVRQNEKTMLMATHSQEVIGIADRILTFEAGQLVELQPGDLP